ncbi:allantoinase AllB [Nonomuraea soli]|uniref:allantoinase n=1 Tax=Nonomuraea soli TaxID=1032476 RepID=A0A7W0CEC3_9ACTN|nr:allantoinase AllB [Nonomuraea soli]MBA2889579.1 allantoinase [Nonomuraea soli]
MSEHDLVIRSTRVVTPDGVRPATVVVDRGRISAVEPHESGVRGAREVDLGTKALLPGLVDTHVHVNEPGRTHWEGFASATRAAAAGGVTTIVDMPLNSLPPTVDADALRTKQKAATGQCWVDVGFWGGAIPGNLADLAALHVQGVYGFKCFLSPSGVEEFPHLSLDEVRQVMTRLAGLDALLVVHAEDPQLLTEPEGPSYGQFLDSRPGRSERRAVEQVIELARQTGARTHILHVSSAECLEPLEAAQRSGVRITAETCPHYLTLEAELVPEGQTAFKCCPPIRDSANRDRLWEGLARGVLSCVVSDHSPSTADLKVPDFSKAWGGIASLQLGLTAIWTEASRRGHTLSDVVRWMAEAPAALGEISGKGAIKPGNDADLVAFDPEADHLVDAGALHHKNPVTPYHGRRLRGVVETTWLRGGEIGSEPYGMFLKKVST